MKSNSKTSLNKLNFEGIRDLKKVLRMPKSEMKYISPTEFKEIIRDVEKIITIHLYPFSYNLRKEKCLLDLQRWSYHQIYLFVYQNQILWTFGHGDSSQSRSNHNQLLEIFLKDKKMRKKTITAVIAVYDSKIVSYYFYSGFAYSNNDIGSNWNRDIIEKLKKSGLPYSNTCSNTLLSTKRLFFVNKEKEVEIYCQTEEDILSKKFSLYLKKLNKNNKKN